MAADQEERAGPAGTVEPVGEARWPMAGAVLAAMVLTVLTPDNFRLGPRWLLPAIEGLLLLALIVGDPGRIDRRSRMLRILSIGLVAVLAAGALWATGLLVRDLVLGGPQTNAAGPLLQAGVVVWASNNLAFALLYWELDGGGPAARLQSPHRHPDFAFPQHMSPDLAPPGWQSRFVDYLYLGFTNALAFSPTDVMPLAAWAKLTMAAQSLISLAVLSLVVARAVNAFT